jgi:hypothetical protein
MDLNMLDTFIDPESGEQSVKRRYSKGTQCLYLRLGGLECCIVREVVQVVVVLRSLWLSCFDLGMMLAVKFN